MSIYDKASLVLIPSGTKTSKVYSQKPVNGDGDFTFSRSTAATRVNADGNIEKETQNLLLYSSDQSNSAYNISSGVMTPVAVSNPLTGTNNAYKIAKVSSHPDPYRGQSVVTSLNGCYTASVWIWTDAGQPTDCELFLYNGDVSEVNTKTITITTTPTRYEFFVNFNSTAGQLRFRVDLSTATDQYIYVYGYQLERGLVARDYIETTTTAVEGGITDNVPRLDYTDASCPSLLLEPQRSNVNPYSEYFDTFWNGLGTETITSNYGVSPEGFSNATRFQATSAGRGGMYASIAVNNGTTYTLSFYAKSLSGTQKIRIGADNGCVNPQGAETFEVTTEWQRFSKTITSTQGGWNLFFDNVESGSGCTGTYLNCDMLVYAYQAEAGSYATSYIPTYGSAVTRNVEAINSLDLEANGVATSATNWTWIVKGDFNGNGAAGNNILAQRDEGGFFYRYGSSLGFSGATKTYWTEFNPNGGFAYIWDGTQLRVRRGGSDIRTISAANIGWSAGGTSNWTINYLTITRISFELENSLFFNQTLTNEEIDSLV